MSDREHTTAPAARLRAAPAYALAALSAALYFLAFPGVGLWPLALVAHVPLLVAVRDQPVRRAFALGWVSGIVGTLAGFYWLYEMLRTYSGFGWPLCLLFMFLLACYQGGRMGFATWLYARGAVRGWPHAPVFAAAFVASELVYPLLFPWYFGATLHAVPLLIQLAELGGPIAVSLALVAPNLALAELVVARRARRRPGRGVLVAGLAAPVVALGYGALRLAAVERDMEAADKVRIGIVQPNLPLTRRVPRVAERHIAHTLELKAAGAELVLWSEGAVQNHYGEGDYRERVPRELTQGLGVPTIVGTVVSRPRPDADPEDPRRRLQAFNTALVTDATGAVEGRYDKQFLLMFGEYLPLGETFPFLYDISPNSGRFSPGTSLAPLPLGAHRLSAMICYEDILPSFVNELVRVGDPDLFVNLTNDTWFGDTAEPWVHLALAKFRSVEHRRYLVRAANSGVSAIVEPTGRLALASDTYREETLLGTAGYMRATTPFAVLGQAPWWLVTAASVFCAVWRRPRRGESWRDVAWPFRRKKPRSAAPAEPPVSPSAPS
ncbi:MAG: apolipoprotein N-acyltransferase [Polyangiaceae bacterium]|nr:apolipoprotein N-acyltransferase [Polyangiaceae bacterium]